MSNHYPIKNLKDVFERNGLIPMVGGIYKETRDGKNFGCLTQAIRIDTNHYSVDVNAFEAGWEGWPFATYCHTVQHRKEYNAAAKLRLKYFPNWKENDCLYYGEEV